MSETRTLFALNEDKSSAVFTPFSLVHALSGWYMALLFYYAGLTNLQGFTALNLVHLLYESKDYYIMYHTEKGKTGSSHRNTLTNSVGDQISAILGAVIFYSINKKWVTKNRVILVTIIYIIGNILSWSVAWGIFKLG
jgi:hypothetical protein